MSFGALLAIIKAFRYAAPRDRRRIFSILRIHRRLQKEVQRFQKATGLQCVSGCGKCCENPQVETTVLDVIPLAVHLWQSGGAEEYYRRAQEKKFAGQCIFYQPDPVVPGNGRCGVYWWRPQICRLFGFSALIDKNNKCQLVTCPTIKNGQAQEFSAAQRSIAEGLSVPKMKNFSTALFAVDPELAREQLPINEAAAKAIARVGLLRKFKS